MPKLRFQYCKWYVRLFRRWYYWNVPFLACWSYLQNRKLYDYRFKNAWGLFVGLAQGADGLNWYYTIDEIKQRRKTKYQGS